MGEGEIRVRIGAKRAAAEGVVTVELHPVAGERLPAWEPGAHVDLVVEGVHERQYSLCGDSADSTRYRIGVLREADGRGTSRHVHDVLTEGDELVVRGPRNHFELAPARRYLFIAGGIGITPILPMIRAAQAAGAEWRLLYGGRRRASMAFTDELSSYGDRVVLWPQDERGLLDLDAELATPTEDTLVYTCGPEPLLAAVEEHCAAWPDGSLHLERFTARPLEGPVLSGSFEVELSQSGKTLEVPPDRSILEVVRAAGVPVLSSCEEGTCGTCETKLLEGVADHRDSLLDEDEREENSCLMICVSRAVTPRLVLDL